MPGNIRWHLMPSKKFLLARWVKLAALHGDFARSIVTSTVPKFVVMLMTWVPERGSVPVGGRPTSLVVLVRCSLGTSIHVQGAALPLGCAPGVPVSLSSPAVDNSHTVPTTTISSAAPAPMAACI